MNGVPLRRISQAYVIATNTKIDLGNFKLPERLTDDFFKREARKKKRSEDMFEDVQEVLLTCQSSPFCLVLPITYPYSGQNLSLENKLHVVKYQNHGFVTNKYVSEAL